MLMVLYLASIGFLLTTPVIATPAFQEKPYNTEPIILSKTSVGQTPNNCKEDAPGKVTKVELIPDPPERDSDLTVLADVDLDEEITGNAQVNVVILYGIFNIKVFDETFEFCELTTCPASKGSAQQLVITAKIPEIFPKGRYKTTATAFHTTNREIIFCTNFEFVN